MSCSKQQPYLPGFEKLALGTKEFGGSLIKGNPRDARPISIKRAMHVVLRSSLATGGKSMLHPARTRRIKNLIYGLGKKKGIKVYRFANSGNHLHILIQPHSRQAHHAYLRAIAGIIARMTLGVERGKAGSRRSAKLPAKSQKSDQSGAPDAKDRGFVYKTSASRNFKFWDARPYTRIVEWGLEFRGVATYIVQNTLEALGFIPCQPRRHMLKLARAPA